MAPLRARTAHPPHYPSQGDRARLVGVPATITGDKQNTCQRHSAATIIQPSVVAGSIQIDALSHPDCRATDGAGPVRVLIATAAPPAPSVPHGVAEPEH
jgi:hypothetical protein